MKMARNYVKLLEQYYPINKKILKRMIAVLTFLIVTTLFRYEIFYNIAVLISWATDDQNKKDALV